MNLFTYEQPQSIGAAVATLSGHQSDHSEAADFFAGGTDLMQLMKDGLRAPMRIVDVTATGLMDSVEEDSGGLLLGAAIRMSDAAAHPIVLRDFPIISEALLASASAQVRNLATLGGNLLQRTRCGYFRDAGSPCNKRDPNSGCPAIDGENRSHAVFGGSDDCIATYAGDLANALLALDARIKIVGVDGTRELPIAEFHRLPGNTPWLEAFLEPGDLIVGLVLPADKVGWRTRYLKVRDRASFEWALVSAAVAMDVGDDDVVRDVRIAAGGVGTTPWRLRPVEQALIGRRIDLELIRSAAARAGEGAETRALNAFKVPMIERVVARALTEAKVIA